MAPDPYSPSRVLTETAEGLKAILTEVTVLLGQPDQGEATDRLRELARHPWRPLATWAGEAVSFLESLPPLPEDAPIEEVLLRQATKIEGLALGFQSRVLAALG